MVFSIRQNSTLPLLKMRVFNDWRHKNTDLTDDLENATITFAMKDMKTGIFKVANKTGRIELKTPSTENSKKEYYIVYEFTENDTDTAGTFLGQFKIHFFDEEAQPTGSLIVPIAEELQIHVLDSFIKSDIV